MSDKEPGSKAPIFRRHWLVKFAPFRTCWADTVRRGTFTLRGVRSAEARRHLAATGVGDPVLFHHSQQERAVVGVLEVSREADPDPTSADPSWLTCDFRPLQTLARPNLLAQLCLNAELAGLPLLRQPRLAVMPVTPTEFAAIVSMRSVGSRRVPP
jgi:predicted RNA-binding protein with PUA-like domain